MIKKNFGIERCERTRTINVMILFDSIMEIPSRVNVNCATEMQNNQLNIQRTVRRDIFLLFVYNKTKEIH
jgi:hypothetical protein